MRKLKITRNHDLNPEECKLVTQALLTDLVGNFGGSYLTSSEGYTFQHVSGIFASVKDCEQELVVNVEFGMMTSHLSSKVKKAINLALDESLT